MTYSRNWKERHRLAKWQLQKFWQFPLPSRHAIQNPVLPSFTWSVITNCSSQKIFTLCSIVLLKAITTAATSPSTGQVKRYNCTIVASLWYHGANYQWDLELYTVLLIYKYNTEAPRETGISPCAVILLHELLSSTMFDKLTGLRKEVPDEELPYELKRKLLYCVTAMEMTVNQWLAAEQ